MATKKITITLPADQLARIRDLVARGSTPSVSGFVQHAVNVSLQDVAGWGALLAEALEQSGGPLTKRERKWADNMLGARPARRRRAA